MADGTGGLDSSLVKIRDLKEMAQKAEREVMARNIYKRGVFERLVDFSSEIQAIAHETLMRYEDVLNIAGIRNPFELLLDSMKHWDKMLAVSEIPSEEQLIHDLQEKFQLRLKKASKVFVPTDELEPKGGEGSHEEKMEGEDANRIGLALETLLHMFLGDEKISVDDLEVTVGKIPEQSWRTRPYWVIDLKKFKIAVLLNNQYGNRTFVLGYKHKQELEVLASSTKEELKRAADSIGLIHHFVFEDPGKFKADLAVAVQKVNEGKEMSTRYATYEQASAAAQKLAIKSKAEYGTRYKEDPRLIAIPYRTYADAFVSWGHFLGTGKTQTERAKEFYATYEVARMAAQKLEIKSYREYFVRYKEDLRLPSNPDRFYGETFVGWGDFLDAGKTRSERAKEFYSTYEEARQAAQKLAIKSKAEYGTRYKEDPGLPSIPDRVYGEAFLSWGDFLGNGKAKVDRFREFYSYVEAKTVLQALGIKNSKEYPARYKEDFRLPANPYKFYGEAFVSWNDFLGTGKTQVECSKIFYSNYEEAKASVCLLGIMTQHGYKKRYKEDPRLPSHPEDIYGEAFVSWGHFLATGKTKMERAQEFYQTYEEARIAVQKLGVVRQDEYKVRYKEDPGLPSTPGAIYGEAFVSWGDFLGTGLTQAERSKQFFPSYQEARTAARRLGVKNAKEYLARYKEDPRLPSCPDKFYGEEFIDWRDFLVKS